MKDHRCMQTWFPIILLFQMLISCQAPGLNERIIHPPHRIYTEQLVQLSSANRSIHAKARPVEELGKSGLPEQCSLYTEKTRACVECRDDPISIKRCRIGFTRSFDYKQHCRYTPHLLRCLDPRSQANLVVQLQNNQESRFLVQFDMILETLDLIFRNKLNDQQAKKQAHKLLKLIGSSKFGMFQDSGLLKEMAPELFQQLDLYKDAEKKALIEKIQRGYDELQNLRLAGDLAPENALQFLVQIFETGGVDPEVLKIVRDVDIQGLHSL